MWNHHEKFYYQVNKTQKFYLDIELVKNSQGDLTLQEYYSRFLNPWTERDSMIINSVPQQAHKDVQKIQEETHISQFLMNFSQNLKWFVLLS